MVDGTKAIPKQSFSAYVRTSTERNGHVIGDSIKDILVLFSFCVLALYCLIELIWIYNSELPLSPNELFVSTVCSICMMWVIISFRKHLFVTERGSST